jgi:DNA-binding LacI/PurR family transcriptional regulator
MAKRIKMTDVARMAGVSTAVVSAVLNGRKGGSIRVSDDTRQRINLAAKELGYVADPLAVSLAGGRRNLIGVFTYEALFPVEHRDFYHPFLVGIEEEAERCGYDLVLFTRTRDAAGRRRVFRDGVNHLRLADGAILLGADPDRDELERLLEEDFPFVYVGRRTSRLDRMSYSAADYVSATAEMVEYLVNKGHRELAMLTTGEDNESSLDRDQGFALGIARHELALRKIAIPAAAVTLDTVRDLLKAGVTAFVVARDDRARAVLRATDSLGLRAGRDFSLAVLGNDLLADDAPRPHWTHFDVPRQEMGAAAVRLLVERIQTPEEQAPRRVVLPCRLIAGDTVGPVPPRQFADLARNSARLT